MDCHSASAGFYHRVGLVFLFDFNEHLDIGGFMGYYSTEQIDTMNYIQRLKRYGFSLEEIQSILTLSDNRELADTLRNQKETAAYLLSFPAEVSAGFSEMAATFVGASGNPITAVHGRLRILPADRLLSDFLFFSG